MDASSKNDARALGVKSNPKRELALRERLMKLNSDEDFVTSLVHSFSKVSWRYSIHHEARRVAKLNFMWISSKWNSVNGGSSWNWESAEIPEVTSLESKESDSAAARVSIVQYRRASQRQSIRRDRSSMISARSPKSHSMRKSTMSGRMRWRKFRSSLVSVTSSTNN